MGEYAIKIKINGRGNSANKGVFIRTEVVRESERGEVMDLFLFT